jgi:serine/threonine protein kinase
MNKDLARRAHALMMRVVDLDESQREAFIDEACDSDPLLREHMVDLMAAVRHSSSFLETPALHDSRVSTPRIPLEQPESIRHYRIVRTLGMGGMATVYEAIQEKPQRRVALKVLRRGLVHTSAIHRFQFETEVLARLQHPGIAQIYEAGAFDDGQGWSMPFFAMEYVVDAETITAYATRHDLSLDARLSLFAAVCDAVQFGHQHGVIHRDLKPGNILVNPRGAPKVIDFGVARSSDPDRARITHDSSGGELVGTLHYMSPEQCAGEAAIDIRTDVYSLGVVLYQLMCGRLPHDLSRLSVPAALRVIQDQIPPGPAAHNGALQGDIDAIVMKALDKDPDRRYATAAALAADIRRFQNDEPVLARAATALYKIRKFARRHRVPVAAATAVAASLAAGIVIASRMAYVATLAQNESARQERRADAAREAESRARGRAEQEAAIAREINRFWIDTIKSGGPAEAGRPDLQIREALDRASPRIELELRDPAVRKQIYLTFAEAYMALGLFEREFEHASAAWRMERELPSGDPPDGRRIRRQYARALWNQGRFDESRALLEAGLEQCLRTNEPNCDEALRLRIALAQVHERSGNLPAALELMRYVDAERSKNPLDNQAEMLAERTILARVLARIGRAAEAEDILTEILAAQRESFGPRQYDTMATLQALAMAQKAQGRWADVEATYRELIDIASDMLGDRHAHVLNLRNNLAMLLHDAGRIDEAGDIHRALHAARLEMNGADDRETLIEAARLAGTLCRTGRFAEAEPLLRDVIDRMTRSQSPDHQEILNARQLLGKTLVEMGHYDEAEAHLSALLNELRGSLPPGHVYLAPVLRNYAETLRNTGREERALPLLVESHDIALANLGNRNPQVLRAAELVCDSLEVLGRADELAAWQARRDAYIAAQPE